MHVQEKVIGVMSNRKVDTLSKTVKVNSTDHVKTKVILGQS